MYRLSTSLPFLLARLGVRMGELFARELACQGLTLPMYRVLAVLKEDGAPRRLGDLAVLVAVEMSTLSRLIGEMQKRGLVTRDRPADDQRSLAVALTAEGTALVTRLIPRAVHYEAIALGGMTPTEARQLKHTLDEIHGNLDNLDEELRAAGL